MENENESGRISRRDVIKWFAAAAAVSQMGPLVSLGQESDVFSGGYGQDPDLTKIYKPGDVWPLTLSSPQRKLVTVLADAILPEDKWGPAASALRVPDFIDEWISAPYPKQQSSRKKILPGLKVMDGLAQERHGKQFAALSASQITALLDDVSEKKGGSATIKNAESFLYEFTSLCMGAYYGTPEGWKAIGYVGNTPLATFDGPPQEVLDRVGVEQTVKS